MAPRPHNITWRCPEWRAHAQNPGCADRTVPGSSARPARRGKVGDCDDDDGSCFSFVMNNELNGSLGRCHLGGIVLVGLGITPGLLFFFSSR